MKKIINPWKGKDAYYCFGCCPDNPIGLKLNFVDEGEEVSARWEPSSIYQGYANSLHGGIQSLMHDEIGGWVLYTKAGTAGVTVDLQVKFLKPVSTINGAITIKGKIADQSPKLVTISTRLLDNDGNVCSEGTVIYRVYPHNIAVQKLGYPGVEAFYVD